MFYLRIAILSLFTSLMLASCTKHQMSHLPINDSAFTDLYTDAANEEASLKSQGNWVTTRVLENDANISQGYSSKFDFSEDETFTISTLDFEMYTRESGTYMFTEAGQKLIMTYPESGRTITYEVALLTRDIMTLSTNMQGKHMTLDFMRE